MSPEALVTLAERKFGYEPTPLLKPHEATIHKNMKAIGLSTEVAEYLKAAAAAGVKLRSLSLNLGVLK